MYDAAPRGNFDLRSGAQPVELYDAIVLGAGISGLVAASVLLEQGCGRILVVDEYPQAGGNHIDRTIGDYTFDIGSFIFQDDSPLLKHFPELLPHYVPIDPRWARLTPQGVVTQYPISVRTDLIEAGPVEWLRIAASVAMSRLFRRRRSNAWDFARYWIGERLLHRSGLGRYMERFYGVSPERIDIRFAERRMQWIKEHALIRTHVGRMLRPSQAAGPTNTQLARPREGFSHLYRHAVQKLESRGVDFRFDSKISRVRRQGGPFVVQTEDQAFSAERLVSTIPIEHIQKLCGLVPEDTLESMTLMSLFFSFSGERGFEESILYNFSQEGAWKRLTVYSDFYGPAGGREYFAVEVNADHVQGSPERGAEDFRRHTEANGLFRGDLRLEGSHFLSNAYPVYTNNAYDRVDKAIAALKQLGVESIGRQGRFDYQPTARDTTLKAEAALNPHG